MSSAHSSGVPRRFIGVRSRPISTKCGGYCSVPLDLMMPGATAFTWRLCWAHSTASVLVMFSTPARAAPVWTMPGKPRAMLAMMFTIRPFFWGIMHLVATAWVTKKVPFRLFLMTASQPRVVTCSAVVGNCPPALFTSTEMGPSSPATASTSAATCSGSRMSHVLPRATMLRAASSFTAPSRRSCLRPQMATLAPSSPSVCAVARPMPLPPPVMSATCPSKSPGLKMLAMTRASLAF